MFGIGMPEMILILAVALIVIGPKKLPDLAKSLGQALGEFRKATRELKDTIEIESELASVKDTINDIKHPISTDDEPTPKEPIIETSTDTTDPSQSSEPKSDNSDMAKKGQEGLLKND